MCSSFKVIALLALFSSSLALPLNLGGILGGQGGEGGLLGGVLGGDGGLGGILGEGGPLGLLGDILNTDALQNLLQEVLRNLESVLTQLLSILQNPTNPEQAVQQLQEEHPIEVATILFLVRQVLDELLGGLLSGGLIGGGGVTGLPVTDLPVTLPVTVPTVPV